jgi:hypothetical protein
MLVITRLAADCMTAICPALALLPRVSLDSVPSSGLRVSLKTSIPSRISFHRIHEMLLVSKRL